MAVLLLKLMPSSERRKKRRTENGLRAQLLEAHEWVASALPEAFALPDAQVVLCEVSDFNKLIALGRFDGDGRTFVSFDEIHLDETVPTSQKYCF